MADIIKLFHYLRFSFIMVRYKTIATLRASMIRVKQQTPKPQKSKGLWQTLKAQFRPKDQIIWDTLRKQKDGFTENDYEESEALEDEREWDEFRLEEEE